MSKQFLNEPCNVIIDIDTLSDDAKRYIYAKSNSYVYQAQFRPETFKNQKQIALQVYKDYFKSLAIIYPDKDNESTWLGIGNIFNNNTELTISFTDLPKNFPYDKVAKEFLTLLQGDYTVTDDLDYKNAMEAINSGDSEWLDEICGDRCLTEII